MWGGAILKKISCRGAINQKRLKTADLHALCATEHLHPTFLAIYFRTCC